MFTSQVTKLNKVVFPEFNNERIYMQKFYKQKGLPNHLKHWQPTVDSMLENIETDSPIFLMIDQQVVKSNTTHRRPGPHIDGYWIEHLNAHGGNDIPGTHSFNPNPKPSGWNIPSSWNHASFEKPESILLASDIAGCVGYVGNWEGNLKEGGDCTDIDLTNLQKILLEENYCYKGNVTFIHESIPILNETPRTLVRLNLKNI